MPEPFDFMDNRPSMDSQLQVGIYKLQVKEGLTRIISLIDTSVRPGADKENAIAYLEEVIETISSLVDMQLLQKTWLDSIVKQQIFGESNGNRTSIQPHQNLDTR